MLMGFLLVNVKDGNQVIINVNHLVSVGVGIINGESICSVKTSDGELYWLEESYEEVADFLLGPAQPSKETE